MANEKRIYISAADMDAGIAEHIANTLTRMGLRVTSRAWIRRRCPSNWDEEVERELKNAEHLVLVLSTNSMPFDRETKREWFYFDQETKPIHPLYIQECEIHSRLYDYPYVDARGTRLDEALRELTSQFPLGTRVTSEADAVDRIFVGEAEVSALRGAALMLRSLIANNIGSIELSKKEVLEIISTSPTSPDEYQLGRVCEWIASPNRLDKRFVHLTLLVDKADNIIERWLELPEKHTDAARIIKTRDEQAFVLLGAPGSGKTTILRHLQLSNSIDSLRDKSDGICILLNLSHYDARDGLKTPFLWIQEQFEANFPRMGPFQHLLNEGGFLILLDGLNEVRHKADGSIPMDQWKSLINSVVTANIANKIVFSCRTLDYSAPISSPELPVPHIRIDPMSDDQVEQFLERNTSFGPSVWAELRSSTTLPYFRSPYLLQLLVDQIDGSRKAPRGRGDLFTVCVWSAIRREYGAKNRKVFDRKLLSVEDEEVLSRGDTRPSLNFEGSLIRSIAALAYGMQRRVETGEATQIRIVYTDACELIGQNGPDVIYAGCAIGALELSHDKKYVQFVHQLMQEYFAGRHLAENPEYSHAKIEWREGGVLPTVKDLLESMSEIEALPPLPSTGWEETYLFAASVACHSEDFIAQLASNNLMLAARCALQPDLVLSEGLRNELCNQLGVRAADPNCDLRARISARHAHVELGDQSFVRKQGDLGPYLDPDFIVNPGGRFLIGSSEQNESPEFTVDLTAYDLAKYPVTNAEYELFIKTGGYENERFWEDSSALRWLKGEGTRSLARGEWALKRETLHQRPNLPLELYRNHRISLLQAISFTKLARMSETEFDKILEEWYPDKPHSRPRFWEHSSYNHPSQPVVGVCWYEARAYCKWLSIQSRRDVRLPTEVEWEGAARGLDPGRMYPYGDQFDATKSNTSELRLRRPGPVGAFPMGVSAFGNHDMSGGVFEWVNSVFRPYGKTDVELQGSQMVCRGGAWQHNKYRARGSYRGRGNPITRNNDLGFRILRICV